MNAMINRQQALEVAKANHAARMALPFAERVWMQPAEEESRFGYRQGWYLVGGFSISDEEITGQPYDSHQGGWAWV
jgi:hypothetical protein